jgi:hypothetical protein
LFEKQKIAEKSQKPCYYNTNGCFIDTKSLVLVFYKNETNNVSNDELKSILRKERFLK